MKAYQAYGPAGRVTAETPRKAAAAYFEQYPSARKCNVISGETDGRFFTVAYGVASAGEWPTSYKGVTKKQVDALPAE